MVCFFLSPHHIVALAHLQQFVEVFNLSFLHFFCRNLCLFEMDVFIVKCLREERGYNIKPNKVSTGKPYVMSASLDEPASVLLLQMC